jgi:hypothetical protein
MQLSDTTIQILKNFATINANIAVKPGKILETIAVAKNILGRVEVDEEFTQEFGIYDLNEFLSVLDLVDQANLKFQDGYVSISDSTGRSNIKYYFCAPSLLTVPTKEIKMPETDISFTLDNDTFNKIKRAASALKKSELIITGKTNIVNLSVGEDGNETGNTFSIDVDGKSKVDKYRLIYDISNLKFLPGTYQVDISSKLISKFTSSSGNLCYWIALEKNSTYGV